MTVCWAASREGLILTQRVQIFAVFGCFGLLIMLGVSGCGSKDTPSPTSTPAPTVHSGPTVGGLADQMAAVWSSVTSYRTISSGQSGIQPGSATPGTPSAAPRIESIM